MGAKPGIIKPTPQPRRACSAATSNMFLAKPWATRAELPQTMPKRSVPRSPKRLHRAMNTQLDANKLQQPKGMPTSPKAVAIDVREAPRLSGFTRPNDGNDRSIGMTNPKPPTLIKQSTEEMLRSNNFLSANGLEMSLASSLLADASRTLGSSAGVVGSLKVTYSCKRQGSQMSSQRPLTKAN